MRPLQSIGIATLLLSSAAAYAADPVFSEDFEHGTSQWTATDGQPINTVSDDTLACSTTFQHETIAAQGGRVVTPEFAVEGGLDYCLSAWVRGSAIAQPFVGLDAFNVSDAIIGDHWLIGTADTDNGYNGTAVPVTSDGAWHWYAAPFTLQGTATTIRLKYELFDTGEPDVGTADFDDIRLEEGPCAGNYAGADQHQLCGGSAPFCSADGSCGCSSDSDCGEANSGSICDGATRACVAGCRGTDGNGCGADKVCSSTTSDAGQCVAWAPQPETGGSNPGMGNVGMSPGVTDATGTAGTGGDSATPTAMTNTSGGCSVSGASDGAAAPFGFVMLAMIALGLRRRRAQVRQ